MTGLAVADLLRALGIRPELAAGHSYGELVALSVAGAFDAAELLELSSARGEAIVAAVDAAGGDAGAMAAVAAARGDVRGLLDGLDGVVVANDNAPDQVVLSGPSEAIDMAVAKIGDAGLSVQRLPVACAFHSQVVAPAAAAFRERLNQASFCPTDFPVFANSSASSYPDDEDAARALLADQIAEPVRFVEQIAAMHHAGARVFIEAGAGRVLTGLVSRILGEKPHVAVACDQPGSGGVAAFLQALATVAVNGVELDVSALFEGRDAEIVDLARPSRRAPSPTAWQVDGRDARPLVGESPPHGMDEVREQLVAPAGAVAPGGADEAVVVEYLNSLREVVSAQRDVVLGYLGAERHERAENGLDRLAGDLAQGQSDAEGVVSSENAVLAPTALDATEVLLEIVSERTGYPTEMLDLDLDLEADLSIDSIKRVEILGALDERMGGSGGGEVPEELVAVKTLRGIVEVSSVRSRRRRRVRTAVRLLKSPRAMKPATATVVPRPRRSTRSGGSRSSSR